MRVTNVVTAKFASAVETLPSTSFKQLSFSAGDRVKSTTVRDRMSKGTIGTAIEISSDRIRVMFPSGAKLFKAAELKFFEPSDEKCAETVNSLAVIDRAVSCK